MKEDQDLFYMAGELTDAEVAAFEEALSTEDKMQSQLLRQAFAGLPTLKEAIPEPQISFERIQDAILKAEPVLVRGGGGAWNWRRLFMLGTPVVAAGIMVGMVINQQPAAPTSEANVGPRRAEVSASAALGATPAGVLEGEPKGVRGLDIVQEVESTRPVVVEVTPPKPTTVTESVPETRATKPAPRRLVARLDRDVPRPSEGLIKRGTHDSAQTSAAMGDQPAPLAVSRVETMPAVSHYPGSDSVVVVTTTPSGASGANAAIEVSRQDDVILGG